MSLSEWLEGCARRADLDASSTASKSHWCEPVSPPAQPWRVLAASAPGSAHLRRQLPNQDAFALASSRRGALLLVASDGAGSAARGGEGAALAVSAALRFAAALGPPASEPEMVAALLGALRAARWALARRANAAGELRDYACTLLLAIVGPEWLGALQLGDGAIVGRGANGGPRLLTRPSRGVYAGETTFVTSRGGLEALSLECLKSREVKALALLTDGLEPVALEGERPFAPFFASLFAFAAQAGPDAPAQLERFLAGERLAARSHDDKTLLLAVQR